MSKETKRFVLSDGTTLNSKGYKISIEGIDLTRFNSNPVMLFEHNPEKVIGRWQDIRKEDKPYEVVVNGIGLDGKKKSITVGTIGGDKRTITITSPQNEEMMRDAGMNELKYLSYDGYEGTITGWLVPFVDAGYSAEIRDEDYQYKNGTYYVTAVRTTFSQNGGVRKVELGIKLSNKGKPLSRD